MLLTTTDGLIEDQTSIALSPDGTTFYYSTNANDIDRRHIWAVPVAGGTPVQVTAGKGIETWPVPLASGKLLATQSADWKRPQSVGVWRLWTGIRARRRSSTCIRPPRRLKNFPTALHVEPTGGHDEGAPTVSTFRTSSSCRGT